MLSFALALCAGLLGVVSFDDDKARSTNMESQAKAARFSRHEVDLFLKDSTGSLHGHDAGRMDEWYERR